MAGGGMEQADRQAPRRRGGWRRADNGAGDPSQARAAGWDAAALKAAIAAVPLTTYNFPDNTGSVGVAPGWATQAPTIAGATIAGPANQTVSYGLSAEVLTPDNWMVKTNEQTALNARRMGGPAPQPINMLIAAYSADPVTALQNLLPAINRLSQTRGGPVSRLDRIVQSWKIPRKLPRATRPASCST